MASPVHFYSPMPPMLGKVYHTSVTSSQAIDLMATLGPGATVLGGYVSIRASGDVFLAFGKTGGTVTSGGASAGYYLPAYTEMTVELPPCSSVTGVSGYQYLYVTAAADANVYLYKSSAPCVTQYMRYINGITKGGV